METPAVIPQIITLGGVMYVLNHNWTNVYVVAHLMIIAYFVVEYGI